LPALPNRKAEAEGSRREHERIFLSRDLVRRRAIQRAYSSDRLPTHGELPQVSDRSRPYRSLAVSYPFASEHDGVP
jgi:3-methyladenine DNA glycosylase/8-oxoguanine DNA glycosylase